jgi:hypothetical protein
MHSEAQAVAERHAGKGVILNDTPGGPPKRGDPLTWFLWPSLKRPAR